jgi:hypothetical protein
LCAVRHSPRARFVQKKWGRSSGPSVCGVEFFLRERGSVVMWLIRVVHLCFINALLPRFGDFETAARRICVESAR